jgi:N-acetylmuramoyl-L-alanine amidase
MKTNISKLRTNLNKVMHLPKWEKIVPALFVLIFISASQPTPKKTYRKILSTIVIDAGHGGHDPG